MKILKANDLFGIDDGFFTRDDLIEYIEEPLQEKFPEIQGCRAYINKNRKGSYELYVSIFTYNFDVDAFATIDMRKIRRPSDLGKYLPKIIEQYNKEEENLWK